MVLVLELDRRLAARRRRRKEAKPDKPDKGPPRWRRVLDEGSARQTFVVGALLTLPGASYLAGLHKLDQLGYAPPERAAAVVGFNLVMLLLLELPLIGYVVAPDWTPGAVEGAKRRVARHGRRLATIGLLALGAALVLKGVIGLAELSEPRAAHPAGGACTPHVDAGRRPWPARRPIEEGQGMTLEPLRAGSRLRSRPRAPTSPGLPCRPAGSGPAPEPSSPGCATRTRRSRARRAGRLRQDHPAARVAGRGPAAVRLGRESTRATKTAARSCSPWRTPSTRSPRRRCAAAAPGRGRARARAPWPWPAWSHSLATRGPFVLVVEDAEAMRGSAAREVLATLLRHLPTGLPPRARVAHRAAGSDRPAAGERRSHRDPRPRARDARLRGRRPARPQPGCAWRAGTSRR